MSQICYDNKYVLIELERDWAERRLSEPLRDRNSAHLLVYSTCLAQNVSVILRQYLSVSSYQQLRLAQSHCLTLSKNSSCCSKFVYNYDVIHWAPIYFLGAQIENLRRLLRNFELILKAKWQFWDICNFRWYVSQRWHFWCKPHWEKSTQIMKIMFCWKRHMQHWMRYFPLTTYSQWVRYAEYCRCMLLKLQ